MRTKTITKQLHSLFFSLLLLSVSIIYITNKELKISDISIIAGVNIGICIFTLFYFFFCNTDRRKFMKKNIEYKTLIKKHEATKSIREQEIARKVQGKLDRKCFESCQECKPGKSCPFYLD